MTFVKGRISLETFEFLINVFNKRTVEKIQHKKNNYNVQKEITIRESFECDIKERVQNITKFEWLN